ncbi:hypothetical protein PS928_03580 [Pseudomonas fluorescens]|uniref:Uncharacterized protein n=1 Tax=Pseudomonas fluorescens TaxID=294 RepID=A0A5E7UGF1_PSEFL|nr:hypothetical protein PS928_03580 [Pseudomonas fluorescens]
MNLPTIPFARCLKDSMSFAETIQGHRQRRAWERLVSYIESSDSLSDFDKAAAFAEGYAKALVDSDQIEISTERDLLIIAIVDEWRRHCIHSKISSTFSTSLLQGHS